MNKDPFIATLGTSRLWFVDNPGRNCAERLLIIYINFGKDCSLVIENRYGW